MTTTITIQTQQTKGTICRHLYGHFAEHLGRCIYEGMWVGEASTMPNTAGIRNDLLAALRHLQIPVLRWPGGCFADDYHWRNGIGPRAARPRTVNTHWGGVIENNHFGTHEFLQLCELLGCEPYIAGNVGSGTVQEMKDWVEYMNFAGDSTLADERRANGRQAPWRVTYFGVGNENWGCGGNMTAAEYAAVYRRYQTYVRSYGEHKIYKIACGASDFNYEWTETLMREAGRHMQGLSLHYYTVPHTWAQKGSATEFTEAEWFLTLQKALRMDAIIRNHAAIMDRYDPEKRVGLIIDEWGTWYDPEPGSNPGFLYQQNTLRDALVAGLTLNIFNHYCDRVHMANLAQTVNVLQALILTNGADFILTPTYHVFDLYRPHQDATLLATTIGNGVDYVWGEERLPQLSVSASRNDAGVVHVSLCNLDSRSTADVALELVGATPISQATGRIVTHTDMRAHNTFDQPDVVTVRPLQGISYAGSRVSLQLPPMAVITLAIQ
ncbi:MAG: alpha-N-arabinofuranosidase [Caldilineaceae bacterium]|nr:alpha-N-arabinofuranosidase [Caldilineaceae bacterium]